MPKDFSKDLRILDGGGSVPHACSNAGLSLRSDTHPFPFRSKRAFDFERGVDIVGALVGLFMLIPLFLLIAVAIRLSSRGPVFFRQPRYGRGGALFDIYKFRTMRTDLQDVTGRQQTVAGDPRITRVGRFLRATSFDELPQLINVLKGEMALVGPRPHVPGMLAAGVDYEVFDVRYMQRHAVRPGITGLAQVRGYRGETSTRAAALDRLESDLEYVEAHSVVLNLKIIARTIHSEFITGSGY